jgi:hypothetical protein
VSTKISDKPVDQTVLSEPLIASATVQSAEFTEKETSSPTANDLAGRVLEAAGVIFIDENGDAGPGVGLRKRWQAAGRSAPDSGRPESDDVGSE